MIIFYTFEDIAIFNPFTTSTSQTMKNHRHSLCFVLLRSWHFIHFDKLCSHKKWQHVVPRPRTENWIKCHCQYYSYTLIFLSFFFSMVRVGGIPWLIFHFQGQEVHSSQRQFNHKIAACLWFNGSSRREKRMWPKLVDMREQCEVKATHCCGSMARCAKLNPSGGGKLAMRAWRKDIFCWLNQWRWRRCRRW